MDTVSYSNSVETVANLHFSYKDKKRMGFPHEQLHSILSYSSKDTTFAMAATIYATFYSSTVVHWRLPGSFCLL